MKLGITLRNMGEQSTPDLMADCARAAEDAGLESLWITDHIAIPPDDAEGSGGRYLDILTTLAWLAGVTSRISLGSGVLILPYRAKLPTAKQIATVQELSKGRLVLGVGVGWMDAEFKALGIDRKARGRITDETLEFLNECFDSDEMELNGQEFLFKPRPRRPKILIGGGAPHALERAVKYGDGWFPMARSPDEIAASIEKYDALCDESGQDRGQVTALVPFAVSNDAEAKALIDSYDRVGVDRVICAVGYDDLAGYKTSVAKIEGLLNTF